MKTATSKSSPKQPARAARRFNIGPAFTLIELLVVIGPLAVLSAVLLPALAASRAQSKTTACTANFRQWAVSVNLYAADYHDTLPSFNWNNGFGGSYLWDVSPGMVTNMGPYGLTVPMWFCPFRPSEFDTAQTALGRNIVTVNDLQAAFDFNPYAECQIRHNWWVPRNGFPPQPNITRPTTEPVWMQNTPVGKYGYPNKLHSNAAIHVPFISDVACSSLATNSGVHGMGIIVAPASGIASPDPANICPNTAHFVNGVLQGINAAYADGHVETHNQANMLCGYVSGGSSTYWFY